MTRPDHTAVPPADVIAAAELKPCPFCGSTNIDPAEWSGNDGKFGPGCGDCGALGESAEAWNRRAEGAAPTAAQAAGRSEPIACDDTEKDASGNRWAIYSVKLAPDEEPPQLVRMPGEPLNRQVFDALCAMVLEQDAGGVTLATLRDARVAIAAAGDAAQAAGRSVIDLPPRPEPEMRLWWDTFGIQRMAAKAPEHVHAMSFYSARQMREYAELVIASHAPNATLAASRDAESATSGATSAAKVELK